MANEREPETGTPAAPPDDSELAGTPDAGDGSEAGEGEIKPVDGKLAMAWKTKAERVNELEAENARLKALADQRTTTDDRGSEADEMRRKVVERENRLRWVNQLADSGDEGAKALRDTLEVTLESEQRQLYRLEMAEIPKEDRAEVQKLMTERRLRSPADAYERLRGGHRYETLAEENARLRKELETKSRPAPNVDRRVVGDAKAGASKMENGVETITLQEYNRRMADPALWKETKTARDGKRLQIKG